MIARTRFGTLAAAALAATLALAACSNEPAPKPTPTPTDEGSPLEALLQDYLGDWSNEDVTRQLVAMEDLVATCMAEQGFDYTPVDYAAMGLDLTGETLGLEWGSKEFAEQYGYGITTDPVLGANAEQPEDPNAEYVAGMTPTEQEAYYTALYGVHYAEMSDPQAVAEAGWDWRDLGCTGSAQNEVLSGDAAQQDQFAALQQEMTLMMEAAAADPRLAQVNADWAACMADAGFPDLAKVGDPEAALGAEVAALQQAAAAQIDPTVPTGPGSAEQVQAAMQEQLDEITQREIDTAVADAQCRADVGYDDARRAIDTEYQVQFLAEHRTEVQDWLESLNARRTQG